MGLALCSVEAGESSFSETAHALLLTCTLRLPRKPLAWPCGGVVTARQGLVVCSSCAYVSPKVSQVSSREMDIGPVLKRPGICSLDMTQQAKVTCSGAKRLLVSDCPARKRKAQARILFCTVHFLARGLLFIIVQQSDRGKHTSVCKTQAAFEP